MFITLVRWHLSVGIKRFTTYLLTYYNITLQYCNYILWLTGQLTNKPTQVSQLTDWSNLALVNSPTANFLKITEKHYICMLNLTLTQSNADSV